MKKTLSVVVPTYNEVENIRPLAERLDKACKEAGLQYELLFMDDESKGSQETGKIVATLQKEGLPARAHLRKRSEGRGLSSAVLLGFSMAKFDVLLCMDADLQHEPEAVPSVADPVLRGEAEFTVGSRYCHDRGFGFEWSFLRRVISQGATALAYGVSSSTDPMSGFFCVKKEALERGKGKCNPIGFKIGLEIMSRCRCSPVVDVPITFQERVAGESKLSMKQNVLYVQQLLALYWDRHAPLLMLLVSMSSPDYSYVGSGALRIDQHCITIKDEGFEFDKDQFLMPPHYKEDLTSVMLPRGLIMDRIEKLAVDIRDFYGDNEVHIVCVLKGSRGFFSELVGQLNKIHRYTQSYGSAPYLEHYVRLKSYSGTESTGKLVIQSDDLSQLEGKDVLIVEDIIDTGFTLQKFCSHLEQFKPNTIRVATLLEKRTPKSCGFKGDFVGFSIPDVFIVGFCLDYNEAFRDLEHVSVMSPYGIKRFAHRAPKENTAGQKML